MQTATASHKLIRKIKDEKFDEENLHLYALLIQLGARDFQLGVVDESGRLLLFEDYVFNDVSSPEEQVQIVKELYDGHAVLMAGFWKSVTFSFKNNKFAQVPTQLFIKGSEAEYLRFNALFDPEFEQILSCSNEKVDAITVYAVPKPLYNYFQGIYANTNLKYIHQSTALIEGILDRPTDPGEQPLYLYVDRFKLHILAKKGTELIYYNQFPIRHFADYLKYIMLVLTALGRNQQTSKVILWGYIGKNSPHYHEFIKYIRNVSFGERPSHLTYGYMFDEIQDHHFLDLFSMHLLV